VIEPLHAVFLIAWDQKIRHEIHDCALFIPVVFQRIVGPATTRQPVSGCLD